MEVQIDRINDYIAYLQRKHSIEIDYSVGCFMTEYQKFRDRQKTQYSRNSLLFSQNLDLKTENKWE